MSALVEAVRLTKHYPLRDRGRWLTAVARVSFAIEASTTFALVGESGCGKSTTARLTLGVLEPTSGHVLFEGEPVPTDRGFEWRAHRRRMQMIYQSPQSALDGRMPVGRQVMEPLDIHGVGSGPREREARAREAFSTVGLSQQLFDRSPRQLSGGQCQRVVIARALVTEPDFLVCDEPVAALDLSAADQIVSLLQRIQQTQRTTYLFISHDLPLVASIAHQVAVMYGGSIVEQGASAEVFAHPLHPYTKALIAAVPRQDRRRSLLQSAPHEMTGVSAGSGSPANLSGCRFSPRCPLAVARCGVEVPELRAVAPGHALACHVVEASSDIAPSRESVC